MSKAINLGMLVSTGEYFGLTNVVDRRPQGRSAAKGGGGGTTSGGSEGGTPAAGGSDAAGGEGGAKEGEAAPSAAETATAPAAEGDGDADGEPGGAAAATARAESVALDQRVLDARLRALRRRWRLVAPEHGTRTVGPVRSGEVVAIDVEVYDRDRTGGGSWAANARANSSQPMGMATMSASVAAAQVAAAAVGASTLGRIARRVPRFATVELDDDHDAMVDVLSLRKRVTDRVEAMRNLKGATNNEVIDVDAMDVDEHKKPERANGGSTVSVSNGNSTAVKNDEGKIKTKAEPFTVANPTLGKIDPDFDPDKVPLLTLLFEIEKPSTGYVERAALSNVSSSSLSSSRVLHPDERVVEALQHSLFCASLFESMRAEIIPPPPPVSAATAVSASSLASSQKTAGPHNRSVAWLSSEMEESFLPPPSAMAGNGGRTAGGD